MNDARFALLCEKLLAAHDSLPSEHQTFLIGYDKSLKSLKLSFVLDVIGSTDQLEHNSDHDLEGALDPSSQFNARTESMVHVTTEVLLHPVYCVPTCYLTRAWNTSGAVLTLQEFQTATLSCVPPVREGTHFSRTDAMDDRRFYEFGKLTPELHPITGAPCWSMHICQLESIMQMLGDQQKEAPTADLYLLNWLALVGPYAGLRLPPAAYTALASRLSSSAGPAAQL